MTKLVCGHVNVEERKALGGFVTRSEVLRTIARELLAHQHFPPHARPHEPGMACFEGWQIVWMPDRVRLLTQRHYAWDPFSCAESRHIDFHSVDDAVKEYVERAHGSSIDGVPVREG